MSPPHERFGLDVLVELMVAHQSQMLDGTPVGRVGDRLSVSLALAGRAGLTDLLLNLDRQDFGWLCNALNVDRLSLAVTRLKVDGVPVTRARNAMSSHITGVFADGREPGRVPFPVVQDPSQIPGFVHHVPTEREKLEMLERLRGQALFEAVGRGTVH